MVSDDWLDMGPVGGSIETKSIRHPSTIYRKLTYVTYSHHYFDDFPFLRKIAENVKVSTYLTDSSVKTKQLFDRGMSIDEIATARKLKRSTIEDHFVEMSINDPQFPLSQFRF